MALKARNKKTDAKKREAKKAVSAKSTRVQECPMSHTPNEETARVLGQIKEGKTLRSYKNTKEMLDDFGV